MLTTYEKDSDCLLPNIPIESSLTGDQTTCFEGTSKMAALRGTLQGSRGQASRLSHDRITSTLETWHGSITVTLSKTGDYGVHIGSKGSIGTMIVSGNVNDGERSVNVSSTAKNFAYVSDWTYVEDSAYADKRYQGSES